VHQIPGLLGERQRAFFSLSSFSFERAMSSVKKKKSNLVCFLKIYVVGLHVKPLRVLIAFYLTGVLCVKVS